MPTNDQILRRVRLRPYRAGMGPTFSLTVWDTYRTMGNGTMEKSRLGYRLTMRAPMKAPIILFEGEDFGASPMDAIDSDSTIAAILGFLTLRPGDTDSEYFDNYTPTQLEYCRDHAEWLSCVAMDRFGEG